MVSLNNLSLSDISCSPSTASSSGMSNDQGSSKSYKNGYMLGGSPSPQRKNVKKHDVHTLNF